MKDFGFKLPGIQKFLWLGKREDGESKILNCVILGNLSFTVQFKFNCFLLIQLAYPAWC